MRFSHRIPISYTAVLQEESIENAPFCQNHLFLIAFVPSLSWQNRSFSTRNWVLHAAKKRRFPPHQNVGDAILPNCMLRLSALCSSPWARPARSPTVASIPYVCVRNTPWTFGEFLDKIK